MQGPHNTRSTSASGPASANRGPDVVSFSAAAEEAANAAETGDSRADLVAKIRSQIADGSYETPDKLDAALSRMLDEIG